MSERTDKPLAETRFSMEACGDDLWLLRGKTRHLLVDSGTGIVSLAPLVSAIAGKPVTVVALNPHYDHAGAWSHFQDRACHPWTPPNWRRRTRRILRSRSISMRRRSGPCRTRASSSFALLRPSRRARSKRALSSTWVIGVWQCCICRGALPAGWLSGRPQAAAFSPAIGSTTASRVPLGQRRSPRPTAGPLADAGLAGRDRLSGPLRHHEPHPHAGGHRPAIRRSAGRPHQPTFSARIKRCRWNLESCDGHCFNRLTF